MSTISLLRFKILKYFTNKLTNLPHKGVAKTVVKKAEPKTNIILFRFNERKQSASDIQIVQTYFAQTYFAQTYFARTYFAQTFKASLRLKMPSRYDCCLDKIYICGSS